MEIRAHNLSLRIGKSFMVNYIKTKHEIAFCLIEQGFIGNYAGLEAYERCLLYCDALPLAAEIINKEGII